MKNYNETFKELDKDFVSKLNRELKLSYILTDIIFNKGTSHPRKRLRVA